MGSFGVAGALMEPRTNLNWLFGVMGIGGFVAGAWRAMQIWRARIPSGLEVFEEELME